MNTKSRIASILKTSTLDESVTGLSSFSLSELTIETDQDFPLPTNLRLGHLAEMIVGQLIKASTNYKVLYENCQLTDAERTIGEIDFIIQNGNTKQILHVELAYKFYLFDPNLSSEIINNWIGPNRNDSLRQKLEKVKNKQFPLLYHKRAQLKFSEIEIGNVSQALCLLVLLFIPYEFKAKFSPIYKNAIKGYYLNMDQFISLDHSDKFYYLPAKTAWGMDPAKNESWTDFNGIEKSLNYSIHEKQAPLCWQKFNDTYLAFFIVWW